MSKYTTQVRWIVEYYTPDFIGTITERIQAALPHIFNFSFPIYKETHRQELETKIIRHYFMKEIGVETVQLWKLFLEERLNLIMPYYNKLYKALDEEWNWRVDYDIWEDYLGNQTDINSYSRDVTAKNTQDTSDKFAGDGTSDGEQENTNDLQTVTLAKDSTVNSDFPQASYQSGVDYASTSQVFDGNTTVKDTGTTSGTAHNIMSNSSDRTVNVVGDSVSNTKDAAKNERGNQHLMHRAGLNGNRSMSELFQQFRDALMDVDTQIIRELHDLFMEVY